MNLFFRESFEMSTPASIKAMEIAREKAARRHRQIDSAGLVPLTHPWPSRTYYYVSELLKLICCEVSVSVSFL